MFECFNDWAFPIELTRGKSDSGKSEKYATLKSSIKISRCDGKEFFESGKLENFTSSFPRFRRSLMVEMPILIRVYIVQGLNLRPRDVLSDSDAFVKIEFGDQEISDRAHYIPNQANPVFGKRFQVSGVIPRHTILKVSVHDQDTMTGNDLIGSTFIDIEDRVRTKYLANCGLPEEFNSIGYNAWRNSSLPSEILVNVCNDIEISSPLYFPDHVQVAGVKFNDSSKITKDENKKERLALSALRHFTQVPGIGYAMVPEHVETRSLYRSDRPGVEQGKLMMWVEIFDPKKRVPEPIDITPLPARAYELRVIIWNAKDVALDEKNIFGKQMSDIYVKGLILNFNSFFCNYFYLVYQFFSVGG